MSEKRPTIEYSANYELLKKKCWRKKEIQKYFGLGISQGVRVWNAVASKHGVNTFYPQAVNVEYVLEEFGTNVQKELDLIVKNLEIERKWREEDEEDIQE